MKTSRILPRLNRYLAILEKQQKGRQFCSGRSPRGSLDMAEFVRQRLHDRNLQSSPSAARMAFSLVQRPVRAPMQ